MFIIRLILTIALAFGLTAFGLYLITGNQNYLKHLGRGLIFVLFLLIILGGGTLAGRMLGITF
uniref:Uncharacterized protein n=1 Tax=Magnetococcus massalia (strain MO-1) TaxID=451514 RepID=A0A1S7LLM4_MAGMO|nr:exported protein of unknown function [Candidatus Magnetococcus massalia]